MKDAVKLFNIHKPVRHGVKIKVAGVKSYLRITRRRKLDEPEFTLVRGDDGEVVCMDRIDQMVDLQSDDGHMYRIFVGWFDNAHEYQIKKLY